MSPDRATGAFSRLAGWLLPAPFVAEFGDEMWLAFRHRYARTRRIGSARDWLGFWYSEVAGLAATAVRERLVALRPRRARTPMTFAPAGPGGSLPHDPHFDSSDASTPLELLSTMRKDLMYSLRMIARTPIVSVIAVASLALALSATISIFAILNAWLLRPLPYPESERLVQVFEVDRNISFGSQLLSPANYFDMREQADSFEALVATDFRTLNLTGVDEPQELVAAQVMPEVLTQLGAEPLMGRLFTQREAVEGENAVVLVNEAAWLNRFGGDPDFVGSELLLDGSPYTVIGVLPGTFEYLLGTVSLWLPTDFEHRRDDRASPDLRVLGRLRDGVTVEQAEQEVAAIADRLAAAHPDTNHTRSAEIELMSEEFPGETDTLLIQALMLITLAALGIACFNVAGLYLAKTDLRAKEIAVRQAMGASKGRLLRLLLTESVVLAMLAGGIGLVLAVYAIRGMGTAIPPEMPRMYDPVMSATVIAFGLVAATLAGMVFGITPARQVLRSDRGRSLLLETSRGGSSSRARKRLRGALVAGEFALALSILVSAGVITNIFETWVNGDPGFNPEGLLTAQVTLPEYRYGGDDERRQFLRDLGAELDAIPGATDWAAMTKLPRDRGFGQRPVFIEGGPEDRDDAPRVSASAITPSFFSTLEVGMQQGRALLDSDRADTVAVAVVNQRFVDVVFDGESCIGQRIVFDDETIEIVGVMPDIAQFREQGMMPAVPWIYRPLEQYPVRRVYLAVRAEADPYALRDALRGAVWKVDPDQPVDSVQSLRAFIDSSLAGPAYVGSLMYQLGFLALALALMGIYGVVAFTVSQQTREIGIRIALGEQTGSVLRGVIRQGAKLAAFGMIIGLPLAFGLVRMVGASMSAINANAAMRPGPMVATAVILAVAATIACYLPARRATQVDPVVALQEE